VERPGRGEVRRDPVTIEEPLEIRVDGRSLIVLMRTPGHDLDLAAGLLLTEGLIRGANEIGTLARCPDPDHPERANVVAATLAGARPPDWERLRRTTLANAACGLCGRTTIESVRATVKPLPASHAGQTPVPVAVLAGLPGALRSRQGAFERTGGLHAAGIFDAGGAPLVVREDVGRHNAVDKAIGALCLEGGLPREEETAILMVSGRAGFEIVQKAAAARIPIVAAVSAPSTLAVDLAVELNLTLAAFLREGRCNVYSAVERIGDPA